MYTMRYRTLYAHSRIVKSRCPRAPARIYNLNAHTCSCTGNGASAAVSVAGVVAGVVGYRRRVTI